MGSQIHEKRFKGGGGMVGYTYEKSILRYALVWGHKHNLQVVLDPCAQCCPCEASVQ